ncbi:hypothetical protein NDU88_001108, partial [Pleurodeles waltl]
AQALGLVSSTQGTIRVRKTPASPVLGCLGRADAGLATPPDAAALDRRRHEGPGGSWGRAPGPHRLRERRSLGNGGASAQDEGSGRTEPPLHTYPEAPPEKSRSALPLRDRDPLG